MSSPFVRPGLASSSDGSVSVPHQLWNIFWISPLANPGTRRQQATLPKWAPETLIKVKEAESKAETQLPSESIFGKPMSNEHGPPRPLISSCALWAQNRPWDGLFQDHSLRQCLLSKTSQSRGTDKYRAGSSQTEVSSRGGPNKDNSHHPGEGKRVPRRPPEETMELSPKRWEVSGEERLVRRMGF